jgi:hypothetical protein
MNLESNFHFEINEKRMKLIFSQENKDALDKRYGECNSSGHRIITKGKCSYCYRHEDHATPVFLEAELKEREKFISTLPLLERPIDAPYWIEKIRQEKEYEKGIDYIKGLCALAKELYPQEFLS